MGFNAPTIHGTMKPGVLERRQAANNKYPELTAQIQQLPSYPAFIQALTQRGGTANQEKAYQTLRAEAAQRGIHIPDDQTLDYSSGVVRDKTWTERHPVLSAVLITAGFAGGGAALGAMAGGGAASAGAGGLVGSGEAAVTSAGLGAGAGTTAAGSVVGAAGSVGAAGAGTAGAAASGGSLLSKYLIPAASTGIDEYLNQRNADADRDQRLQVAQQAVGYDQSLRDPFRAQMFQANDVGRLERMATPPPSYGPKAGSFYAGYANPAPTPQLSDDYLNTVKNAQAQIARGQHPMPNMVDPANWGDTNTQDLSTPRAGANGPAAGSPNWTQWMGEPAPAPTRPATMSTQPLARRGPAAMPASPDDPYQGLSLASLVARYGQTRQGGGINA